MCIPGGSAFAPCERPVNPLDLSATADMPLSVGGSLRAMKICVCPSSIFKDARRRGVVPARTIFPIEACGPKQRGTQHAIAAPTLRNGSIVHAQKGREVAHCCGDGVTEEFSIPLSHGSPPALFRPQAAGEPAGLRSPMPQP